MTKTQKISRLRHLIAVTHTHAGQLHLQLRRLTTLNKTRRAQLTQLTTKPRVLKARREGLDYTAMNPGSARWMGATFACRYLSHDPSKNLTRGEAATLKALGLDRVVVWETTATRALDGYFAGRTDAQQAHRQARACGAPHDVPIYFAVDFDSSANPGAIDSYFDGVKSVLGIRRTGAYGGIATIRHLLDTRRITWAWQTYAWSGGAWDHRAHIQQYDNTRNDYDRDRSTRALFGQW